MLVVEYRLWVSLAGDFIMAVLVDEVNALVRLIQLYLCNTRTYGLIMPIELCATVVVQLGYVPLNIIRNITALGDAHPGCIMH